MEVRRKVILQHPEYQAGIGWLQVVVWEGSLADLLRRLGYAEIIEEPADEPLEINQVREGQADGNNNTVSGLAEGDPGGAGG